MDASERTLLAKSVHDALARVDPGGCSAGFDAALADLGWLDMLEAEPSVAAEIVFGALGATNGVATALDDVMLHALGANATEGSVVLLPPFGTWDLPGHVESDRLEARGLAGPRVATAREAIVVCESDGDACIARTELSSVEAVAVRGIDPGAGLHTVVVRTTPTRVERLESGAWERAVALGRRAVAHEMSGASHAMLELARAHALERVQFGRAIARFQAVRHRLAEALVAIEALDAALAAAADAPGPDTAALAKALAGRTARTVAAHCQQVLAGIGFTTDHPFHRYLKRTLVLDGMLGSADELVLDVGRRVLATRSVPTLIDL